MNPGLVPHLVQGVLPILLVVLAALIGGWWPHRCLPDLDRWLGHRAVPWLVGLITALVIRNVWGGLDAVPTVHDEAAYLLQAGMLARGQLAGSPRPLPEFFEQFHVFVTPVLAARYPPGFAIALVPGIWLGLPGLMPVILNGLTGALLFALVKRLVTPTAALLAWLLWVVTPASLRFRPLYLTEALSGLLWLAAWWSLLEWRRTGRRGWLLAVSTTIGWQAITRPLTAIAFAIPIGVVVLVTVWRQRRWADWAIATAAGLLWLAIIPYQNQAVTGNWRLTPLSHYSTVYFPFDLPGFGYDSTPPQRALPADFQAFRDHFSPIHKVFTPDRVPGLFVSRSSQVLLDAWGRWWPSFAVLGLIGVAVGGVEILFGVATCLVLLLVYLTFAHADNWTVYYLEEQSVLIAVVAVGAAAVARWLSPKVSTDGADQPMTQPRRVSLALVVMSVGAATTWSRTIHEAHATSRYVSFDQDRFRRQVARLNGPAIVFIRYGPEHDLNRSLIANEPDLDATHAWLVYDRGADNRRLMALAPARTPWLYDEARHRFVALDSLGVPVPRAVVPDSTRRR